VYTFGMVIKVLQFRFSFHCFMRFSFSFRQRMRHVFVFNHFVSFSTFR